MRQETFDSHRLCENQRVEEFGDKACSHELLRKVLDSVEKKPGENTKEVTNRHYCSFMNE